MSVRLIRTKLQPPRLPEPMVSRPRLARHLGDMIERSPVTVVCATAGAGKTTATLEAATRGERPLAWLTLDDTDVATGRLLTYLQAALATVVPHVSKIATDALAQQAPHVEAAGLLADAVDDSPVLLVIDEMDRLAAAPPALAVINALLRYAPPTMRVVCISRTEIDVDPGSTDRLSRVAALGEQDLAFTIDEAAEALREVGHFDIDPTAAVEATGGWVTGVLFEAWRSESHRYGAGGDADPLHGYLASQILGRLSEEQRDLLVRTSVLDIVSADDAAELGVDDAQTVFDGLRHERLPGSWSSGGECFRPHMRFREYLSACLQRRPVAEVRSVRAAHGERLAGVERYEDATEAFLAAESLQRATDTSERAIFAVLQRGDLDMAERWIDLLGEPAVQRSRTLMAAELMLANAREDFARAQVAADRIVASYRDAGDLIPGTTLGLIGWCYYLSGRFEDERAAQALTEPSPEATLIAYTNAIETCTGDAHIDNMPENFGCALDDLILRRQQLAHGRLREALTPAKAPWWRFINSPWYIDALLVSGRLSEALAFYEELNYRGFESAYFNGVVAPSLLAAIGRPEEAMAALADGRDLVTRSGASMYLITHLAVEAKLALRLDRDTARARAALAQAAELRGAEQSLTARLGISVWGGLRLLLDDEDAAAYELLRETVDLARRRGRRTDLVSAAVYYSEAAWRRGDEAAADLAADLALDTSRSMGSNQLLLLALRDFPAVAARRLDLEREVDTEWHAIARVLSDDVSQTAVVDGLVTLHDLGKVSVEIGGEVLAGRLRKSLELLALLAGRPNGRATREELRDALFDGRADDAAGAYLRQAVTRLRQILPDGVLSKESDGTLSLTPGAVISDAGTFEARIGETQGLRGPERRRALVAALYAFDGASYLVDVDAAWANARRNRIEALVVQAHIDVAQLAFEAGDYAEAAQHADRVVEIDPYRESAWRLLMRVRSVLGDDDGVIATFKSCADALHGVGIAPADATRDLLVTLRR